MILAHFLWTMHAVADGSHSWRLPNFRHFFLIFNPEFTESQWEFQCYQFLPFSTSFHKEPHPGINRGNAHIRKPFNSHPPHHWSCIMMMYLQHKTQIAGLQVPSIHNHKPQQMLFFPLSEVLVGCCLEMAIFMAMLKSHWLFKNKIFRPLDRCSFKH